MLPSRTSNASHYNPPDIFAGLNMSGTATAQSQSPFGFVNNSPNTSVTSQSQQPQATGNDNTATKLDAFSFMSSISNDAT